MAIENDKVVSMFYELKDANSGEILDSNKESKPIEFILGRGHIIPGLEEELKLLNEGDEKDIKVTSSNAYGEYKKEALQTLPREQFAGIELNKGMTLFGQGENGQTVQVTVSDFTDSEVTVDYNHPLAGKDLLFAVNIVGVRDADEDELATGVVGGASTCCGTGGCGDGGDCCGEHDHETSDSCCGEDSHSKKAGSCCG